MSVPNKKLSLGIFMPNCSNMCSISSHNVVEDQWTFVSNQRIAHLAEQLNFDYLFPVSRWRGFGGDVNYLGTSLETMTWASALLQTTSRIKIFSTVHVPLFHPFVVAKMGATMAHMSGDRWGLNLVSGWSNREFSMMGLKLPEHGEKYQKAAAFIEILQGLWQPQTAPFNYASKWYNVVDGVSLPRPVKLPEVANAGASLDAQRMTARLCDWAFMSLPSIDAANGMVDTMRARADQYHRSIKTAVFPFVLWRDTEDEAQDEIQRIIDKKDSVAAQNWFDDLAIGSESFDFATLDLLTVSGGGIVTAGTAQSVAEQLQSLNDAGVDAVMLTFQNYEKDLKRFAVDVLPILQLMGVV